MSENDMTLSQEELRKSEPQAVEKPEAAAEPAEVQEAPVTEAQEEPAETDVSQQEQNEAEPEVKQPESKTEVIDRLKELAKSDKPVDKNELEQLKKAYYRFRHAEVLKEREAFLNGGGAEDDFMPQPDTDEESFKAEMSLVKEKRAKQHEALEQQKRENLQKKQQILEEIKKLSSSPEEANKNYEQFRKLQAEWRETNPVPAENATDLWKSYQLYVEQFYDLLKLNSEFREYDFKKNYEAKIHICEAAEKLLEEPDPVSAFHQLQKLHQEFREIGPVAKDLRESVWERFKSASTQINKRHQEYYEKIKAREEENLVKKTALCEKVEGFELDKLKSFADWDKVTKEIIAIQAEWKTIGFTPKNMNAKIFERFRKACDAFFKQKSEHFKELKSALSENYAKKMELCEKAESLKDNTDWNPTTNIFIALQKEWKTIGAVPKKYSDAVWKRFSDACNAFFAARDKATSSQRAEDNENLEKKRSIVERLKAITADAKQEGEAQLRSLMEEWQSVGHIPYKYKDKLYKAYREQVDRLCKELDVRRISHRAENLKAKVTAAISRGGDAMLRERDRLFRAYEAKRNEIKTYENNLGFLNAASKSGNSLLDEMKRRMESLKAELEDIRKSIEDIDAKAKEPAGNETTEQAKEAAGAETAGQSVEDSAAKAEKETEKPADNPGDTAADK